MQYAIIRLPKKDDLQNHMYCIGKFIIAALGTALLCLLAALLNT